LIFRNISQQCGTAPCDDVSERITGCHWPKNCSSVLQRQLLEKGEGRERRKSLCTE
jgi:hypothetical protein